MKRVEFIDFDEFSKLYKACKKDKKLKLAMLLGFGSGLRISEIVGLRESLSRCCKAPTDIKRMEINGKNVKRHFCTSCNAVLEYKDIIYSKTGWKIPPLARESVNLQTHQIRLDVAKGGKWRVTITPKIMTEDMLELLPINMPRRTLQYRFDVLCKKALGKKISFHILRHGFGNYAANVLKLPLPMVQQFMGHSRLDTTGIYTKVNPEHAVNEAWKAMGGG